MKTWAEMNRGERIAARHQLERDCEQVLNRLEADITKQLKQSGVPYKLTITAALEPLEGVQ